MDTITHAALGAAIGEATLGKQMGWRAAGIGAVIANIPDIDLITGLFTTRFELLLIHRSVTHSLLFCLISGVILGRLLYQKYHWVNFQTLSWMTVLCLLSHVMLDTFNSIGTQLFYPVYDQVISLGNIFVIDPLYTVPLLTFTLISITRKTRKWRRWMNNTGLFVSTFYLILTFTNQAVAEATFTNALHLQGKSANRKITHPTPLNNLIWYTVVESPSGFFVGFCDLRNNTYDIPFQFIPKNEKYGTQISNQELLSDLNWMTNGYLAFDSVNSQLFCYDIRLGIPFSNLQDAEIKTATAVFSIEIQDQGNTSGDFIPKRIDLGINSKNLALLWKQIWSRSILDAEK